MALATTADYQAYINRLLWYLEGAFGIDVGTYNQDGSVQISPMAFKLLRYGYAPQSPTNWPEQSTEEAADQADIVTIVTAYLAYKKTRMGQDTDNTGATLFH
jgi:hypothetical protein